MLNALPPTVPQLLITGGALPQPQLNQFPAITAGRLINVARVPIVGQHRIFLR
jgi:hypothetical protein